MTNIDESPSYQAFLKSPNRSIKYNTYFQIYDCLFSPFRDREITFVEIGVLGGGSLFMWREFFGDKARIIGVDLNPNAKKYEEAGFEIYIGSQNDPEFWKSFVKAVGPVDIVLDDGGHTYEQQIVTTEFLLDSIKDHGLLVVEDTHTSYMRGFGPRRFSFLAYVKRFADRLNFRFEKFSKFRSDRRVWSIQIFESVVAFHVNRSGSEMMSSLCDNGGYNDEAIDFRHFDQEGKKQIRGITKRLRLLRAGFALRKYF
ncbi:MAG: class I SAM-dependent methyltransferase [Burkholderiaceae bacterium]